VCNGTDPFVTGSDCTNTVTGVVTTERMSRTPDERLYSSGTSDSFAFTQCYVSLGDPGRRRFSRSLNAMPMGASRCPGFRMVIGESRYSTSGTTCWSMGLSAPVRLGAAGRWQPVPGYWIHAALMQYG